MFFQIILIENMGNIFDKQKNLSIPVSNTDSINMTNEDICISTNTYEVMNKNDCVRCKLKKMNLNNRRLEILIEKYCQ